MDGAVSLLALSFDQNCLEQCFYITFGGGKSMLSLS